MIITSAMLTTHSEQHNGTESNEPDEDNNDSIGEIEVGLDVSSGEAAISSDLLDYQLRPQAHAFKEMSVWEFMECACKVIPQALNCKLLSNFMLEVEKMPLIDNAQASTKNNVDVMEAEPHACGWPHSIHFLFASEDHPQYKSHKFTLHRVGLIPVTLGGKLPNSNNGHNTSLRAKQSVGVRPFRQQSSCLIVSK